MSYYCLTNKCGYYYSVIKNDKRTVIVFKNHQFAKALCYNINEIMPSEKITVDTKVVDFIVKDCENTRINLLCIDTNEELYNSDLKVNKTIIDSLEFTYRFN